MTTAAFRWVMEDGQGTQVESKHARYFSKTTIKSLSSSDVNLTPISFTPPNPIPVYHTIKKKNRYPELPSYVIMGQDRVQLPPLELIQPNKSSFSIASLVSH